MGGDAVTPSIDVLKTRRGSRLSCLLMVNPNCVLLQASCP